MARKSLAARRAASAAKKAAKEASKLAAEAKQRASIVAGMPAAAARVASWATVRAEVTPVTSPVFETVGTEAVDGKATPGEQHPIHPFKYR